MEPSQELGNRMDSLSRIPLRPGIILAISLASFFTYYDVANYAYISPSLKNTWGVTDTEIAGGASITIIGYVAGAISITLLADARGRKIGFLASIVLLGAGSLLAASAQDMAQLMVFRFITGAGIGSELVMSSVYIGEMSPKSKRGRYTSYLTVLGWTGLTLSGPISLFLLQGQFAGIEGWRAVLGIAGVVALVLLPFRVQMSESPRWLLSKGRLQEANHVLQSIGVEPLQSAAPGAGPKHDSRFLRNRKVVRRLVFMTAVWILILLPIYSSLLLVVEYVNQGYTIPESISIGILSSTGFVAGGVVAVTLGDRLERKYQIAIASLVLGVGFVLRGIFINDFVGLVVSGFIAFFGNAWVVTALLAYTAENFPTFRRSTSAGIVEGSSRGLAAVSPFIFVMLQPYGFMTVMAGFAAFAFASAGVVAALGTRTRGKSLEELNREAS